jgi:DNA-binding transcriptional LysR family regulator
MVLASEATTIAPERFVEAFGALGNLHTYRLPARMSYVDVDLVWHGRYTHDRAHQWLRDVVRATTDQVAGQTI